MFSQAVYRTWRGWWKWSHNAEVSEPAEGSKGDLGLLYVDDDEDADEDVSYEEIEGDENVKWDFHEDDWGLRSMRR